jgi:hypothetical protein
VLDLVCPHLIDGHIVYQRRVAVGKRRLTVCVQFLSPGVRRFTLGPDVVGRNCLLLAAASQQVRPCALSKKNTVLPTTTAPVRC